MADPKKSSKKKIIIGEIGLHIPAGMATPAPPIGPALGQRHLNIMEFCKAFNEKTKDYKKGTLMPVIIWVLPNKKFIFEVKKPTASGLIKEESGCTKGSKTPGRGAEAGKLTWEQCRKIAQIKASDLNTSDIEAAMRIIMGQARSMGIQVVEGN